MVSEFLKLFHIPIFSGSHLFSKLESTNGMFHIGVFTAPLHFRITSLSLCLYLRFSHARIYPDT